MFGADSDPALLDDRYLGLSYDEDRGAYVVLDPKTSRYFLMDTAGPDTTSPIADDAGGLLDYLWDTRLSPRT
jgi:hypothetical protein